VAEEHNIYGGLGSVVAEVLVEQAPVPMERVGIQDAFAESGTYDAFSRSMGSRFFASWMRSRE
jgi:transketolase